MAKVEMWLEYFGGLLKICKCWLVTFNGSLQKIGRYNFQVFIALKVLYAVVNGLYFLNDRIDKKLDTSYCI